MSPPVTVKNMTREKKEGGGAKKEEKKEGEGAKKGERGNMETTSFNAASLSLSKAPTFLTHVAISSLNPLTAA